MRRSLRLIVLTTQSSLPSLYNLNVVVADKESLDIPVNFAFNYFENGAQIDFDSLKFNDEALNLQGYSSYWNSRKNVFYGNLVFELWIYNGTLGGFQYHERFVDLKFNMTS
jgi:hypothetical protein